MDGRGCGDKHVAGPAGDRSLPGAGVDHLGWDDDRGNDHNADHYDVRVNDLAYDDDDPLIRGSSCARRRIQQTRRGTTPHSELIGMKPCTSRDGKNSG